MSKQFEWIPNPNGTTWHYSDYGYSWGSVARVSEHTYGVFVRYERFKPLKWVTHVDNLDEAKALVQTLVGASNV